MFYSLGQHGPRLSNNSLDKYNYALETLKLGENGDYFNENNCMLRPKCRQPYVHNERNMKSNMLNDELSTPKLPPRPPLPKTAQPPTTIDKDLAKQQQLSDWYYIKTGPKSPLPAIRAEKQIDVANSTQKTAAKKSSSHISGYGKSKENSSISSEKKPLERVCVTKENSKSNQNTEKYINSGNPRLIENIQMIKPDAGKSIIDTMDTLNYPNVYVLRSGDVQHFHIPSAHQYSVSKFNYCNDSEKDSDCLKRQLIQENLTSTILSPSPVISAKKVHQPQSHPFYYIDSPQKHFSTPRLGSQQKMNSIPKTSTIIGSNSNSNIHKIGNIHSQQLIRSGDVNSSSFERINVPNVISPLSTSSQMAIEKKANFINQSYTKERICCPENNATMENQGNVPLSPYMPAADQPKVSKYYNIYYPYYAGITKQTS